MTVEAAGAPGVSSGQAIAAGAAESWDCVGVLGGYRWVRELPGVSDVGLSVGIASGITVGIGFGITAEEGFSNTSVPVPSGDSVIVSSGDSVGSGVGVTLIIIAALVSGDRSFKIRGGQHFGITAVSV